MLKFINVIDDEVSFVYCIWLRICFFFNEVSVEFIEGVFKIVLRFFGGCSFLNIFLSICEFIFISR